MERIYCWTFKRPKALLALLFLLTALFAHHARRIRLDSSVEGLLPKEDPEKEYYEEVRRLFGNDGIGVIGVVAGNVYTPEALSKIKRLTEEIQKIPEVKSVLSLANAQDVITSVAEENTPLLPEIPTTEAAWQELKAKLANHPIYLKNLVSPDGRAAAINISFFGSLSDEEFMRRGVDDKIQALVDREQGPEKLYYSGLPHFKVHMARSMREDLLRFVPLTLLWIVAVLFLSFHSLRGVLLPALTIGVSLIWTLGIMVLFGSRISLGSISLPPLLLVLGTAYSLHVIAEYYELAHPDRSVPEVILQTLRKTAKPVFITALTTALGFSSLAVNRIASIQEMGLYSALGISIAFVLSVILVPALLALLRLPARRETSFSPRLSSTLQELSRRDVRYRKSIIAAGLGIALLSAWQIPSIRVDSNFQSFFRPDDPISQANNALNRYLAGSTVFYVVIDGQEKDLIRKWDTLRRIKELQLYIDSLPGVEKTISFVDYCEMLDRGIQAIPPEDGEARPPQTPTTFWENPSRLDGVLQLVFLNSKNTASVVNHPNYSRTNIIVRTSLTRASDVAATVEKIQAFARKLFPPELKVHPTGELILHTRTRSDIVVGQIQSLALAATVIFLIMSAMFLSVRIGLMAMVPNLFPILVFFGLMGASGAVLSLSTNTIAAIVLGIAVDDTIHLMTRLSSEVRATENPEQALLRTFSTVGKPVFYTSLILFLGFLTLCLSTFVPIQEFGFLSATTIGVALVGDVVLLPALLATTRIITLWDLLYLKLGQEPHRSIPLFEGLRPFQAKVVTLMGELRSFRKGEVIVRQGEMGDEMYVVLKGAAEAVLHTSGGPRFLRRHERGDVFGEMGLIRRRERTADVVAAEEEVEVLAVDERFLTRVQRRYPRIASRIFLNLAKILSDRLQEQTQRETP